MRMTNTVNERNTLKSGFINAVVILMLSSFWARILGVIWLSDVIYAVSLVVVVLKYFSYPLSKSNLNTIFLLLLTVFSVIRSINQTDNLDVDFFLHAGITTCVFMCLDMCANRTIQISESSKRNILRFFIASGFFLEIYYYFGGLWYAHISKYNMSASLNLDNPNEAGLWMACYIIILVGAVFILKRWERIAAIGVSLAMFPILSATDSRNSLYAVILFVIMTVVLRVFRIKKIPKSILLIISVLPVIVFFFYMYVIVPNMDQWSLMVDIGKKAIDSREFVWKVMFDDLPHCFLFGNYAKYCEGQMHNSLMTLYCRYGIFYLVCAVMTIYQALKIIQKKLSVYSALGLCGLLFTGCFEGSLFIGVAGLYLMLLIVPALLKDVRYRNKDDMD